MSAVRLLGVALVGGGLVLVVLGFRAHDSFASSLTRLFSGAPTRESVLLLAGGAGAVLVGMVLIASPALRARSGRGRRR